MAMDRSYGIDAPVEARVDAFRGNPQALEQKFAQGQNLLDLLALQKIKSEKEDAMRDMLLKMAAQQAEGGGLPTVMQQREQQVMDLTKQELAQQQQGLMQQRDKTMRERMQNMLMGIAQNPAPNVAEMAGGGIVAFAGPDGSLVEEEQTSPAGRMLSSVGDFFERGGERNKLRAELIKKYGTPAGIGGFFMPQTDEQRAQAKAIMSNLDSMSTEDMKRALSGEMPTAPKVAPQPAPAAPQPAPAAQPSPQPAPQPAPAAQPRPQRAPQPRPSAAAPAQQPAPQTASVVPPGMAQTPKSGIQSLTEATAAELMTRDPEEMAARRGALMEKAYLLSPEEVKARQDYMARMQAELAKRTSPEQERRNRLRALAMGAANKSNWSSMGAGIAAEMAALDESQSAKNIANMEAIEKMRSGIADIPRLARIKGVEFGEDAYKQGESGKRQGVSSGTSLSDIISKEREGAKNREYNYAKLAEDRRSGDLDRKLRAQEIEAAKAVRAAQSEANNQAKIQNAILATERLLAVKKQAALAPYATELQMLTLQRQGASGGDKTKIETEIKRITDLVEAEYQRDTVNLQSTLENLYNQTVSDAGFKVTQKSK